MRTFRSAVLAGFGALVAAGTAIAASPDKNLLNVALPDGSVARIEYEGKVAPKVTIMPRRSRMAVADPFDPSPFALFNEIAAMMERQRLAILRHADALARHPLTGSAGANLANYGNLPAGTTSYSVVTTTNGATTCTRTVEVTSLGGGKPPKVVSRSSGQCGAEAKPSPAPVTSSAPVTSQPLLNRT